MPETEHRSARTEQRGRLLAAAGAKAPGQPAGEPPDRHRARRHGALVALGVYMVVGSQTPDQPFAKRLAATNDDPAAQAAGDGGGPAR